MARELDADGEEEEVRERVRRLRDEALAAAAAAASTVAPTTITTTSEFSDDDEEFASFDMEAAIASSCNFDLSNNSQTPAKRSFDENENVSSEKRFKPPDGTAASAPSAASSAKSNDDESPSSLAPEQLDARLPSSLTSQLSTSLLLNFGHPSFRPGQLSVINAVLEKRDCCAFWATGAGKSICYQFPPVHLGEVGVIVTPLVSLMMDQCAKLNSRYNSSSNNNNNNGESGSAGANRSTNGEIATYLGSAQSDPTMEMRALNGEFRLIYVTPEKLVNGSFLERLGNMHERGWRRRVCLFAVDESHCVSEWVSEIDASILYATAVNNTHLVGCIGTGTRFSTRIP